MAFVLAGHVNTDPYDVYIAAAHRWIAHQPLYETRTIDGFQYLPQTAILFIPFAWLGSPAGDLVWRALGWTLYALGIWRWTRRGSRAEERFLIATTLTILPAIGSLANGQANLAVAALTLHVAADLSERHWWRATLALTLGLALKPLMAVLLLLVLVLYRPMTWRLIPPLILVLIAPFFIRDHSYVITQYRDCLTKMSMAGSPDRYFEDLRGLAHGLGWRLPHSPYLLLRALAALGTLALCLVARRRFAEPESSLLIAALASGYLMLFNPRTQSNSYVVVAPLAALYAAGWLFQGRRREAFAMLVVVLCWSGNTHQLTFAEYWLKPLATIGFCALLIRQLFVDFPATSNATAPP